jgi:molybdopterin-guanine dinucleotide biosynthesis protein A
MEGVSVIIVCGGRSNRVGQDKKFLVIGGRTLLDRTIETAWEVSGKAILVVGSEKQKNATEAVTDLPVYVDETEGVGPLMGVLTGLKHIDTDYGAMLPIDTPFAKPELIGHLASLRAGYDGVVPVDGVHLEPLHGVYRRDAMIEACQATLEKGERSVSTAVRTLDNLRLVPVEELKVFDPKLLSFRSVNTPEDLESLEGEVG